MSVPRRRPAGQTIGVANKQLVMNELRARQRASADALVRATGLSLPTVQKWLGELEAAGYVKQAGLGESTGGRPPVLFEFVNTRDYVVGLAVEIPAVSAAVMDLGGQLHDVRSTTLPAPMTTEDTLAVLFELVDRMLADSLPRDASPSALGLAFSGFLDSQTGRSLATPRMPQWRDVPVRTLFAERYGVPATLIGHIDALTVAEITAGLVPTPKDFLYFDVGWGVGTRVVHAGDLVVGAFGNSGLIGHTTVVPDGRQCICGNRGCLEEYASGRALVRLANDTEGLPNGDASNVDRLAETILGERADAWLEAPPIREFIDFLTLGIANAINIFDIPNVVLGGYMSTASSRVRDHLKTAVEGRLQPTLRAHLDLTFSGVPRGTGSAFGAAATALRSAFPYITPIAVRPDPFAAIAGKEAT